MISHTHKCIFIHIPKCAGTSIEKVLGHFDETMSRGRQDHRSIRMLEKPFNPLKAIKNSENIKDTIRRFREYYRKSPNPNNKLTVDAQQYRDYYKFSIVRNPWDRAYSWYKNVKRDPIHQHNYGIPAEITFDDFIQKFSGTGYLREQCYWLENYNNEVALDFVGKFENLHIDFNKICIALNLPAKELPHEVKSTGEEKTECISKASMEFIAHYYKREIVLFDYNFERDCSLTVSKT